MTAVTAAENSITDLNDEPPMKKQKVDGGTAVATASADNTDISTEDVKITKGRPKKRKRSKSKKTEFKIPCNEMPHFKAKNYSVILLNYLRKIKGIANPKLVFKTTKDTAIKLPGYTYFVSTCTVNGFSGKGRANTMKRSKQKASLCIIQKQGLVPPKMRVDTMEVTLPSPPSKEMKKPIIPITEYKSYLRGNFKGALWQYLRKNASGYKVNEKSEQVRISKHEDVHITTCIGEERKYKAVGRHTFKKKSIQLAYLNFILNMKLISKEQYLEKHLPFTTEQVGKKTEDIGKPSKNLLSVDLKEERSEKKSCDSSKEHLAQIVKQDVAKLEDSAIEQNVDEPSKKCEQENQNVDESSKKGEDQKEDAQESIAKANEEVNVNEKQNANEVREMEVEIKAAT